MTERPRPQGAQTVPPRTDPHHDRRWLILVVIAIAQLMVVLDATIVNIALPSAQRELGFSDEDRQWVITAYALAFGSLLLLGGRIADLFGRKWTFVAGLIGFAGRVGARRRRAELRAARRRPRAAGRVRRAARPGRAVAAHDDVHRPAWSGRRRSACSPRIAGAGGAIGLLLGGALTEYVDWRWCLYVNGRLRGARRDRRHACCSSTCPSRGGRGSTSRASLLASAGLFALVFGLLAAPRPTAGATPRRSPASPPAPSCSPRSSSSSGWSRSRCCRCGSSPTATAAARSSPSASPAPACSALFLFLTFYLQETRA